MTIRKATPLCLVLLLVGPIALADASGKQLVKSKFSGAGKIINVFAGKAAREGLEIRTTISGDRRATMTGRSVEVIDLGDQMIWRYAVTKKGKPKRKCEATTFDQFREQMAALGDLPFLGGDGQSGEPAEGAPEPLQYEVTLNFSETDQQETHAGMTGKVFLFEAIAHRPGLPVEEGGGVLDATFVVGPKTEAWTEMQAWNRKWAELIGEMMGIGGGLHQILANSPALQKVMAELKSKESQLDGTILRMSSRLSTVTDPRMRERAKADDRDDGGDVPTSIGGLGAKLGGAFLKKKSDETAKERKELYMNETAITYLSNEADALLTLPDSCAG